MTVQDIKRFRSLEGINTALEAVGDRGTLAAEHSEVVNIYRGQGATARRGRRPGGGARGLAAVGKVWVRAGLCVRQASPAPEAPEGLPSSYAPFAGDDGESDENLEVRKVGDTIQADKAK